MLARARAGRCGREDAFSERLVLCLKSRLFKMIAVSRAPPRFCVVQVVGRLLIRFFGAKRLSSAVVSRLLATVLGEYCVS